MFSCQPPELPREAQGLRIGILTVPELSGPGCDPARSLPRCPLVTRAVATAVGTASIPPSLQGHTREEGQGANTTFWDKPLKSLLSQSRSTQGDDSLPHKGFCLLSLVAVQLCRFFSPWVFLLPCFERRVMAPALPALHPLQLLWCQPGKGSAAGRLCHLTALGRAFPHRQDELTHGMRQWSPWDGTRCSWNPRMVWKGSSRPSQSKAVTPSTIPGFSKPFPTWPWTLPGMG